MTRPVQSSTVTRARTLHSGPEPHGATSFRSLVERSTGLSIFGPTQQFQQIINRDLCVRARVQTLPDEDEMWMIPASAFFSPLTFVVGSSI